MSTEKDRAPYRGRAHGAADPDAGPPKADGHALDEAIAASAGERQQMLDLGLVRIHTTGRVFRMAVPPDLTADEALVIVGWLTNVPAALAARKGPQLVIPKLGLVRQ